MRGKHIFLLAEYGLAFATIGCKTAPPPVNLTPTVVQSVVVSPELGELNYARPGDILEFIAFDPNTKPFFVNFDPPSPCGPAVPTLLVTATSSGKCTVVPGIRFYTYSLSYKPKDKVAIPQTCPQCQLIVIGSFNPNKPAAPEQAAPQYAVSPSAISSRTSPAVNVGCEPGSATTLDPLTTSRSTGDTLWWYPGDTLTITSMPNGVCAPGAILSGRTNLCVIDKPKPGSYTYTAVVAGCSPTNGTLTIK
jgi:hypothetical protein